MAEARQTQLDTVRACAVLAVLYQHTMRPQALLTHDAGAIGVVVFFVLSGFLISGILLDARRDAESIGESKGGVLRRFYIRRFLRIFPLYYAVIAVAFAIGEPNVRQHIGWLATYTTNFLMAKLGANIGVPTPFWSLAVEEQFYLFWPFVVLFVPRKRLPLVTVAMVALSLGARFAIAMSGAKEHAITMPTWCALDGLAIGAMLALAHRSGKERETTRVLWGALGVGLALMALRLVFIANNFGRIPYYGLWMFPWALIGVWVVDRASRDKLPAIFRWRAFAWVGVISYGIYVYHRPLMTVLGVDQERGPKIFLLICAVTIVVASLSWIVFERPINNQKRRWPYVLGARRRAESAAVGELTTSTP